MMGTNYYARIDACEKCGRSDEAIHLGKLSAGWAFLFRWHHSKEHTQSDHYNNFGSFCDFVRQKNVRVFDEYGKEIDKEAFVEYVSNSYFDERNKRHNFKVTPEGFETHWVDVGGYDFCEDEFS